MKICRRSPRGNVDWNTLPPEMTTDRALSFPTRERGLKLLWLLQWQQLTTSFPTRERGLKWYLRMSHSGSPVVPHEGTWIEMEMQKTSGSLCVVVPHEGTWIEIPVCSRCTWLLLSFPTRERGLKCLNRFIFRLILRRSPRGNVDWNKEFSDTLPGNGCRSPRGNVDWNYNADSNFWIYVCRSPRGNVDWNLYIRRADTPTTQSFPTRERGLKLPLKICRRHLKVVVPHEGTWIEISGHTHNYASTLSFPTRERGLKWDYPIDCIRLEPSFPTRERGLKLLMCKHIVMLSSRSPRGNVDWNPHSTVPTYTTQRRSPRGNVDWNWSLCTDSAVRIRRSPRGNVDWNYRA